MQNTILDKLLTDLPKDVTLSDETTFCGREISALTLLEVDSPKKMFGFIPVENSCIKTCEYAIYEIVDNLTEEFFTECMEYVRNIEQNVIQSDNPYHSFSMISLYFIVDEIPANLTKTIQKFEFDKKYDNKTEYGYVTTRLFVINSATAEISANAMGRLVSKNLQKKIK